MKIAYADPPYLGVSRHYDQYHERSREWDSIDNWDDLIRGLEERDRWALSLSAQSLMRIFLLLPAGVRIGAWIKAPVTSWSTLSTWEPVVFKTKNQKGWQDALISREPNHTGLIGAKPVSFCRWVLAGLGIDGSYEGEFEDMFPGTGIMTTTYSSIVKQHMPASAAGKQIEAFE